MVTDAAWDTYLREGPFNLVTLLKTPVVCELFDYALDSTQCEVKYFNNYMNSDHELYYG